MRLDLYLVQNDFFKSRSKAQEAVKSGCVYIDGKAVLKCNIEVENPNIELKNIMPYVSRGGLKLEKAIESFHLEFKDKVVLDIGASTGGFTDCALKYGARKVYSVDVGSNQLDQTLRLNPKVISMENTNVLDTHIEDSIDYIVMDVSFVTIEHLIPALKKYLNQNNLLICLIKPQFEVGKMINKGIIKNPKIHLEVLNQVNLALNDSQMFIKKIIPSPIKGGSGNIEFLALISSKKSVPPNFFEVVKDAHKGE